MGSTLPQCSHIGSRPGRVDGAHLTRKRGIYYWRRRLPARLGSEVSLSLGTRGFRVAEYLAAVLDGEFLRVVTTVTDLPQLRSILRAYLAECLEADTQQRLAASPGKPVYDWGASPDDDPVDIDLDAVADSLGDARRALAERDYRSVARTVGELVERHGIPDDHRNALAQGILEVRVELFEEMKRRVLGQVPQVFSREPTPASFPTLSASPTLASPLPEPPSPLFSAAVTHYVDFGVQKRGWRGQSKVQNEATYRLFVEVCGDRPISEYTRQHLGDLYDVLCGLPAMYAKDKRWRGLSLREIVEAAKDDPSPRLAMATLSRHFSALGGFFTYAKRHGLSEGDNPAHGFDFPRKGRANSRRDMWEGEPLRKLFRSPVWTGCHPFFRSRPGPQIIEDANYWLPLLGLYHGNRLEEFAQLRREDIMREAGIWCFRIHGEAGRQIKNAQSERRVPLHPEIERRGFLAYVERTAPKPVDTVFPLLKPGGPDNKVGYYFTKWWSNYRKAIGLYKRGLDYHSFRHGVTTKLFAAGVTREIIDELTGHEAEGTSGRVYKKAMPIQLLRSAIEKLEWPELADDAPQPAQTEAGVEA